MASDPNRDRSEEDSHLGRFLSAGDVAASLLPAIAEPDDHYSDAFTQQIVRYSVEGLTTFKAGRQLPMNLRSKGLLTEGVAFHYLGDRVAFAAANGLTPDLISATARDVETASDLVQTIVPEHTTLPVPPEVGSGLTALVHETADATLSLLEQCRHLRVRIATFDRRSAVANTRSHRGVSVSRRTELHVELQTAAGVVKGTWVDWDEPDQPSFSADEIAMELNQRAARLTLVTDDGPKTAAVLLPPGWGGTWMHEAVGHLLEADTATSDRSALHDRYGNRVTIDAVTIVDDGTLRPSRFVRESDDEGVATTSTTLIDGGIVVGLLTDRVTAAKTGLPLTGNGRRAHFGLPPRPRMTNLLLRPGASNRADMISSCDELVLLDRVGHAWLNAQDGKLYMEIEEASLFRQGRFVRPLGGMVASADPLQLLSDVVGVGTDFAVDLNRGYCLKDGASLPVTIGQPSVLVRSMQFMPAHSP
ncbi:MAG: TldD/PmbA family protein [Rhodothermales bacterium]